MAEASSNFCALPFGHTTVNTSGNFLVCCVHSPPAVDTININQDNYTSWQNSNYLNQVRQSFKENKQHPGCSVCWQHENKSQPSLRTKSQKEYKLLRVTDSSNKIVNLEIQLGNLCNLKCLMCNENESSAILAENIQLKINQHNQKDFRWSNTGFDNLKEMIMDGPQVINVRGGEPLYNKELLTLIEEIPEHICSNTLLHITTNATQWSKRWQAALEKFRIIRFMFSVDAVGELYEYIRFPGHWNTTCNNIKQMACIKNNRSLIYCVVQNLNILSIGDVIMWAKEQNLHLQLEQLINPEWLSITNLPGSLKVEAVDYLDNILSWDIEYHIKDFLIQCKLQLEASINQPINVELWNKFQSEINMRDNVRQNSHRRFLLY
jgi:organic radical activating enzyme